MLRFSSLSSIAALFRGALSRLVGVAALSLVLQAGAHAETAIAEPPAAKPTLLNEQITMINAGTAADPVTLETTLYLPPGIGPFPVVIMNHGKALGNPRYQERNRFLVLSREFVKHGYAVVIPMRKGFSKSGGTYIERGCDMAANGEAQADDVRSTLTYLRSQQWADKDRIIVAGQSYGGLATMAFGAHDAPGVRGLINFAGGLRVYGGSCQWQTSLVDAFTQYGARSTLPSLWFYGANDSHFDPATAAKLYNAYNGAGGHAKLVAFGAFKKDAHALSGSRDGVKIWWPETEKFLKELGMPTEETVALADDPHLPKSDFAALNDIDAIPYLEKNGREQYKAFLGKSLPRAFAVSPTGTWSWAEEGDDPAAQVLANCQKKSKQPCKLYAVDDYVVYTGK